jgi:lon-related putative ATP-dependent protease
MGKSKSSQGDSDPDHVTPLTPNSLKRSCDPSTLGFNSTDELPNLEDVIGQPRAFRSLKLGTEVAGSGYNIFVLGQPGSGKTTLVSEYLERRSKAQPIPDDWCYVNNFANPYKPIALRLPRGQGVEFRKKVGELVLRCQEEIKRAFESKQYTREKEKLLSEGKEEVEEELRALSSLVEKNKFTLVQAPFGFMLVPTVEGKPLSPEEIEKLSEGRKEELSKLESMLQEKINNTMSKVRAIELKAREQIEELETRTARFAVDHLVEALKAEYSNQDVIHKYMDSMRDDIIAHVHSHGEGEEASTIPALALQESEGKQRYEVNVIVDNSSLEHAPMVIESNPSYHNLVGRIEHRVIMGASRTDFTMIKPGALHRANGGYLLLPARDLLLSPYAWEGLKRSLREETIRISELGNQLGLISTVTLEPEPIPLQVKVVLIGTPLLYYLLRANDEDYSKLFKVRAEFATQMERTRDAEGEYALFIKNVVDRNQLPPFDSSAVSKVIEYGARLAEDQDKLSTRFGGIADLIREAAYWTQELGNKIVSSEAVEKAIEEQVYRSNLIEEDLQEMIERGSLLVDLDGEFVGQVNALSVLDLGDYSFARPLRVTASVHSGKGGVLDIEREAELGGSIHTKGVLILGGVIGARYGSEGPLNLSASLTMEQSYGQVEGDSASAAELFALLSALADVPIRQDCAVTGSINQRGEIQAVGGINEKIEGFFTTCQKRGLSGSQGVLIPASNQQNLMLKDEVISAVQVGDFHIWPIQNVDQGLTLLTGMASGELEEDGRYPEGSFNAVIMDRLATFREQVEGQDGKTSVE